MGLPLSLNEDRDEPLVLAPGEEVLARVSCRTETWSILQTVATVLTFGLYLWFHRCHKIDAGTDLIVTNQRIIMHERGREQGEFGFQIQVGPRLGMITEHVRSSFSSTPLSPAMYKRPSFRHNFKSMSPTKGRVFAGIVSYALGAVAYVRHEHVKAWCCGRFGGHDTLQLCFNEFPQELEPSEYTSACYDCLRSSGRVGLGWSNLSS